MSRRITVTLTVLSVVAALALASCADSGRPDMDDWAGNWAELTAAVPTVTQLGSPPDRSLCSRTLGQIRAGQRDLIPTPDLALDPVVREWFTVAEDAMFECPPSSSQFPDFEYSYQELARLEAEIEAVLALTGTDD
jgi:hypothetical protein